MEKNDFVRIEYIGRIKETGELFDTTSEEVAKKEGAFNPNVKYGPAPVIVGRNKIIKGVDDALLNMKVGDKKTIEIEPERGFGKRKPELIKLVPVSEFKKQNINPVPGMPITMNNIRGRILSVNSGRVKMDFNHPLAGKNLIYEIEVKEKIDDKKGKVKAICDYYKCDVSSVEFKENYVEIFLKKDVEKNKKQLITNDVSEYLNANKVVFSEIFEPFKKTEK